MAHCLLIVRSSQCGGPQYRTCSLNRASLLLFLLDETLVQHRCAASDNVLHAHAVRKHVRDTHNLVVETFTSNVTNSHSLNPPSWDSLPQYLHGSSYTTQL